MYSSSVNMADGPSLVLGAWSPETLEGLVVGRVDTGRRNRNVSSPLIADRDLR
jgi:hypothetical protein